MKLTNNLILIAIILLGFFLRVVVINSNPPALYGDELTIALDSFTLLKTGHDQLGNFLPLTFPMGAGRPALYVYGSIPFVALFGPSALGVRMLSVLSGLGIIIMLYLLGKKFFSRSVGLIAALIVSVSPWDIALSRGGFEAHFALFLSLLGVYFFLKAKEKGIFYIFSALSFGATLHTYPTYKVTLLLFLPLLFWYQNGGRFTLISKSKKYFFSGVAILIILGILSLSQIFLSGSEARFGSINVFSQSKLKEEVKQKINFERQITNLPESISKYFHNKPVEYTKVLIENYLQNFSLDFLVLHGDRNPRHNMATMGEIYLVEVIFIFAGLLSFWQKQKRTLLFLLAWILIAPIPTALIDLPHVLRSAFLLPPLVFLSGLGLMAILIKKNKLILFFISVVFIIQFLFFVQKLYFLAPNEYSHFWSYSAKLASGIAIENKEQFKYVLLSDKIDNIEFAYPVYNKIDPKQIIDQNRVRDIFEGYPMKRFDNIFIGHIPEGELLKVINNITGSVLFLGSQSEGDFIKDYETINGLEDEKAIIIKRKI